MTSEHRNCHSLISTIRCCAIVGITIAIAEIIMIVSVAAIILIIAFLEIGSELGSGVSKSGMLSLRPGMSNLEIEKIIGKPLSIHREYGITTHGEMPKIRDAWIWIYGEPAPIFGGGLEVVVKFCKGRMTYAHVEYYDLGVYRCNEKECPVIYDANKLDELP